MLQLVLLALEIYNNAVPLTRHVCCLSFFLQHVLFDHFSHACANPKGGPPLQGHAGQARHGEQNGGSGTQARQSPTHTKEPRAR